MITPTQQAYGQAATNMMQSMIDDLEQRRKEEAEKSGKKPKADPVIEAKISASEEAKRAQAKISEALFSSSKVDINELRMDLIEQLGNELGLDIEEAKSSYGLGKMFEEAVKTLDFAAKADIEKALGLDKLDISLDQFVASVKNPYGDENEKLKGALEKQAGGGSSNADIRKVVQRLEEVADPKTLEELKLGPQYADPTRVVDAETKAERLQDIAMAEASEKLGDVQEAQELIEQRNELAANLPEGVAEEVIDAGSGELLQVLAAAAENVEAAPEADDTAVKEAAAGETQMSSTTVDEPGSEAEAAVAAVQGERQQEADAEAALEPEILAVHVDDIGLYSLLEKYRAAA